MSDVSQADVGMAEAFGDLADALAASEEGGGGAGNPVDVAVDDTGTPAVPESAPPATPGPGEEQSRQAAPTEHTQSSDQIQASTQQSTPNTTANQAPEQAGTEQTPELQPLNYTVNGQGRVFDGGFIVPGQGAVISNDALPKLQDRLQQADRLVQQNQTLYNQVQEIQKLGGRDTFEKLTAQRAMLDASASLLLRALTDQNTLVALATDPVARQHLLKELALTARETEYRATTTVREQYAREQAQAQSAQDAQTALWLGINGNAQAYPGLTAEDVNAVWQLSQRMQSAIVRPATPAEAQQANVRPGDLVIDHDLLHAMLQERHALRSAVARQGRRRPLRVCHNAEL